MHADAGWTCKKNKDKVSNCTLTDNAYLMCGTVPQIGVKKKKNQAPGWGYGWCADLDLDKERMKKILTWLWMMDARVRADAN